MNDVESRLRDLENRISILEGKGTSRFKLGKTCKKCGMDKFDFVRSVKDPVFGDFGKTIDTYKCANCELTVDLNVDN
jgi:hypothetical protein